MMLRRTKRSLIARLALGAALCFSVAASFGLHPEPADPSARVAGFEIAARASAGPVGHDCLACVSRASAILWPGAAVVLASAACDPVDPSLPPPLWSRLAGRDLSGRSPPERS